MLKEKFRELKENLLSEIISFYGERLVSVVVFGSVARETQTFDSDIDLLIIAQELPPGRMKRIREFDYVEDKIASFLKELQEEGINTYISSVIKSPEEAEKGNLLFLDMVEDAQILFDKGGFFATILDRLRKRLKEGTCLLWRYRFHTHRAIHHRRCPRSNRECKFRCCHSEENHWVKGLFMRGVVFTNIGSQPRNFMAAIDAATGLAASFPMLTPTPGFQLLL